MIASSSYEKRGGCLFTQMLHYWENSAYFKALSAQRRSKMYIELTILTTSERLGDVFYFQFLRIISRAVSRMWVTTGFWEGR